MLQDPIGLSLVLVAMVILVQHACGAAALAAEHDGAFLLLVLLK